MIWSATPYCGEADILEIRLGMLDGVVDRHLIAESRLTQRGTPKPLYFLEQRERFAPWLDKIAYLEVGLADFRSSWAREHAQRDAMRKALELEDDDLLLLSDLDEIPRPELLDLSLVREYPLKLEMTMHMYYLNWCWLERPVRYGTRSVLMSGKKLRQAHQHTLTEFCEAGWPALPEVAGWHLAYQMGPAAMRRKIGTIADDWCRSFAEYPLKHFQYCQRTGSDLFDRLDRQCEWVPDSELPPYAVENRDRFEHMFIEAPVELAA